MQLLPCTGDAVAGDIVTWTEAVWPTYQPQGRFARKSPKPLGEREVTAQITADSYGAAKQQHTFTLLVLKSTGYQALEPGAKITRKGRNIYRNGTIRQAWKNEAERESACIEKHRRGDEAREARRRRRE